MTSERSLDRSLGRLAGNAGATIRQVRHRRRRTIRDLAQRAGLSPSMVAWTETGNPAGLATYIRLTEALDLQLELQVVDPRARGRTGRPEDPVHAAMGELEARNLSAHGFRIALDEPFQHYQFAGRADLLAYDLDRRALLHIENRTRFPNIQDAFGSYNAKRSYLPAALAQPLGLQHGWDVVTHAIAALWSAEVLHILRLRRASFEAVCPNPADDFEAWWSGSVPRPSSPTSTLVVLDPAGRVGRRVAYVGLAAAAHVRPRYRGYADAVERQP
jgi:transcriptional regulator with XRE-family HTH domain